MAEVQQQAGAVAREFGMVLMPIIKNDLIPIIRDQLVPAIRSGAQWFADLDDKTKRNALALGALAASAGPVMMAVGAFGKLAVAIKGVTVAMLANPYMAAGIALLAFTGYAIRARHASNQLTREFYDQLDAQLKVSGTTEDNIRLTKMLTDAMQVRGVNSNSAEQNRLLDERIDLIRDLIQINAEMMSENIDGVGQSTQAVKALNNITADTRPIRIFDENVTDEMVSVEESLKRLLEITDGPLLSLPEKIFPPGSLGAIRDEMAAINEEMQFLNDPDAISEYQARITTLTEEMSKLKGETQQVNGVFEILERLALEALESISKGIAESLVFTGKLKVDLNNIIKQLASKALQQFIMMALTGGTSASAGITGGILGRIFPAGDALIKSNGDIVQFHPNDNLMAWQGANMPSGGSKSITLNIPIVVDGQAVWTANRNFEIDL